MLSEKTSDKNKYFWVNLLRNTPKREWKVLTRFYELCVHVSHRAVLIPQKWDSRLRILSFCFWSSQMQKLWQKKKKMSRNKQTKKRSSERPRRALCCPFSNLPVSFLVRKLVHLFSKVYFRGKNVKH